MITNERVRQAEVTDQFIEWWSSVSDAHREVVTDRVHGSRHQSMKELGAAKGGALRVLFSFDPISTYGPSMPERPQPTDGAIRRLAAAVPINEHDRTSSPPQQFSPRWKHPDRSQVQILPPPPRRPW